MERVLELGKISKKVKPLKAAFRERSMKHVPALMQAVVMTIAILALVSVAFFVFNISTSHFATALSLITIFLILWHGKGDFGFLEKGSTHSKKKR